MKSIWNDIESELVGLETEYYDADMDPEKIKQYGVEKIPVYIFLDKNNHEIFRLNGVQNKQDLLDKIKENLDK